MKIVSVIPARGGSKGIPKKNIIDVNKLKHIEKELSLLESTLSESVNDKKVKELITHYKTVFGSDEGKSVISDLEKRCHYNVSTFSKDSTTETAFMEGQRSVLLFIKAMISKKE